MAERKEDLDRNEPATPFKLEKARKRGSIVRSAELTFAGALLACVACVYGLGWQVVEGIGLLLKRSLSLIPHEELTRASSLALIDAMSSHALKVVAPAVFVVWLAALLTGIVQARGVLSAQPLKPDFTRLSPANALRRVFSIKSLHELWRGVAKLAAVFAATALWGAYHLSELLGLSAGDPRSMAREGLALFASLLALLTGLMLAFALLDWSLNRSDFMRRMRMSKREIKDEHKEREGDPRIKARLRELRLAWLKRARELSRVRSADVLLTNPTHYAVALEYRHGEMPAPMITARGAGEMARRMRAEARRRSVPVVEHPPLARALYALDESHRLVPEEHFVQVARILRWVYAARAAAKGAA